MGETIVSRSNDVKVLLEALVSARLVDNIKSTKLDVSLIKKLKTTLLKFQVILTYAEDKHITTTNNNNLTVGLWLETLRTNAIIQIYYCFGKINAEVWLCKVEAPEYRFNRMNNCELQRSIGRLGVSNSSSYWNGTSDLVDDSSILLLPLSTSVKVLLERLVSSVFVDFFRTKIVDDSSFLNKLKIRLAMLQDVLNYSMGRHFTNPTVMEWFGMLQYDVFEVETLFDEINNEALGYKGKIASTSQDSEKEIIAGVTGTSSNFLLELISQQLVCRRALDAVEDPYS